MNEGKHYGGYKYRNRRDKKTGSNRGSIVSSLLSVVSGLLVKDLSSNDSKIKKIVSKFFKPKITDKTEKKNKIIKPEYEVLENSEELDNK
ncbi:MAG: hypothetical protein U9N34_00060 [Candidatus Cloacimonadota bacterium]|nr:hypothetical protein [Candidatus Cloacimonadota bacterium]